MNEPRAAPDRLGPAPEDAARARQRANRRGVRLMVAAAACFVVNDSLVKFVSQALPAAQLIFVRGLIATALVLLVLHASSARVEPRRLLGGWVAWRAGIDAVSTMAYLVSLFQLPLANATAISMATPLFVTVIAVVWLGAKVGAARWAATALGFAGVLLVIQPRAGGFNAYAWLCLFSTLLRALSDLATPRISREVPTIAVTLATAAAVTLLAGVLSLVQGWAPMTGTQLALLAAAATFLASGYHLLIRAMRSGDLALVAPFRYSGLLIAVMLGWAVWGDVPNALAWAGIVLVMGAGLVLLRR